MTKKQRMSDVAFMPPFQGFPPQGLAFLRDLAEHQERAWFETNRAIYETALRRPMIELIGGLSQRLAGTNAPFTGNPERSIFRIHRDVRFSKDKRPYKTNIGAALTRSGAKGDPGVLYIHIDPDECFVACGFYQPEPALLHAMRSKIERHPEVLRGVLTRLEASNLALSSTDTLKRPPRGFEHVAEPVVAQHLKLKSFVTMRKVTAAEIEQPDFVETIAGFATAACAILELG